jgi:hypothetical protein
MYNKPKNVFNRLVNNSKSNKEENLSQPSKVLTSSCETFTPAINPISEIIDYKVNGESYEPRWEKLYLMQNLINENLEEKRREKEELK